MPIHNSFVPLSLFYQVDQHTTYSMMDSSITIDEGTDNATCFFRLKAAGETEGQPSDNRLRFASSDTVMVSFPERKGAIIIDRHEPSIYEFISEEDARSLNKLVNNARGMR